MIRFAAVSRQVQLTGAKLTQRIMSDTYKALEKQFYSDGYRLGMSAVQEGNSDEALNRVVQEMHRMVDEVIAHFSAFAESRNQAPDCRKGCSWCCYQPVFALSYELDNLFEHVKKNFKEEEQERIYAQAAAKRRKLRGLKGEALLNSKAACPLLENGACIAYAARPVACRIYLSSDVKTCMKFYSEPEKKDSVPALPEFPLRMGRMINEGFRAALKAGGVPVEEYRLEEFNKKAAD